MDGLAIASIGMQADLRRAESISHNIANVLTVGFKRHVTVASDFHLQVEAAHQLAAQGVNFRSQPPVSLSIDARPGLFRHTGNPQDVAIEGDSFFEIQTATGLAYTRQGNFRVNSEGQLVTGNGSPVSGAGSGISLTNTPFSIAANGEIKQADRVVGRVKLVKFTSASALQPDGAGVYLQGAAAFDGNAHSDTLKSGFLEGSNVSTPQEMVRLTETVRHFESLQKFVQGHDESLEKAIRKLGEF